MFRDLKEYQEIAKIYAEKVSKPENLDENRNQMATKLRLEREANKPAPEPKVKPQYQQNRDKLNQQRTELNKGRAAKQFSALKAKPMVRKPGATSVRQSGANDSRLLKNKVDTPKPDPKPEIKKVEVKKEPEVSTMTKQGKPRTKAQMMAAKRIASGKTIADVKAENQASMKARAKAKFEAFKKRRAEKKAGMSEGVAAIPMVAGGVGKALGAAAAGIGAAGMMMQSKKKQGTKGGQGFGGEKPANAEVKAPKKTKKPRLNIGKRASGRDRNFIQGGGAGGMESVEYDAYDLVLEYLLSTEQVATIEEANYVMTEMDANTIGSIVKEVKLSLQDK